MTTPAPLTPQQLDEIETRAQAATDGPWTVELEQCDCSDGLCSHGTYVSAVYADGERRTEFSDFPDADWQFAIRARTDVPALVAELKQARAAIARVRRLCADPVHQYTVHRSDVLAALDDPATPAP
jgi:hypothetical protein